MRGRIHFKRKKKKRTKPQPIYIFPKQLYCSVESYPVSLSTEQEFVNVFPLMQASCWRQPPCLAACPGFAQRAAGAACTHLQHGPLGLGPDHMGDSFSLPVVL